MRFLFSVPRSGLNYLASALNKTHLIGEFRIITSPPIPPGVVLEDFYSIVWNDFISKINIKEDIIHSHFGELELIPKEFKIPSARYVFLDRRDKIRQGISYLRASCSEPHQWNIKTPAEKFTPKSIERCDLDHRIFRVKQGSEKIQSFISENTIGVLELFYEDIVPEKISITDIVRRLLDFYSYPGEIPADLTSDGIRIADEWTEAVYDWYTSTNEPVFRWEK